MDISQSLPVLRICSTKKCKTILPPEGEYGHKTCSPCRAKDRERKTRQRAAQKRQREEAEHPQPRPMPPVLHNEDPERASCDEDEADESGSITHFESADAMFCSLRKLANTQKDIVFHAGYIMPSDPLISDKEHVQMTVHELWKVTGYRFTVRDNPKILTGYKTRLWCSQDAKRKKAPKPRKGNSIVHRDYVGMHRFNCLSRLIVTCRLASMIDPQYKLVSVSLEHHSKHVPYFDVSMPAGASQIIRDNLLWSTPVSLVTKVQELYPTVSAAQIHSAWTIMSEELWKKDKMQLPSAKALLEDYKDVVDTFQVTEEDGVEQLCWGMKKIVSKLDVKATVVEIALDATYETNSKHLELYCVMAEYDNAGFPLSYRLLSTSESLEPGKRIKALEKWTLHLRDDYGVRPKFIHVDKDMAEISMAKLVWPDAKIQICWWHLRKAIRERITKAKLSTTPYNAERAHAAFAFIRKSFFPSGRADPQEKEGERGGGGRDYAIDEPDEAELKPDPNALYIHLPASQAQPQASLIDHSNFDHSEALKIRIPARSTMTVECESASTSNAGKEKRTFCPSDLQDTLLAKIEAHRNAHPLIPGYAAPTSEGIYHWAVKQMYVFCEEYDLRELWAYLWENWYRPARWVLWARSAVSEIPRLKTTMIMESHWRHIKHDFLHHFHKPRLDLLAWILITKLAPSYYRKLDSLMNNIGRFRNLCSWRKSFKREWRRCEKADISLPLNPKYRPNTTRWVCTCPYMAKSRFLICKHLVQAVQPVPPEFFLEVTRNRTAPIWSHPSLVSLKPEISDLQSNEEEKLLDDTHESHLGDEDDNGNETEDEDDYQLEAAEAVNNKHETYRESMTHLIDNLLDFVDGLKYQMQFRDARMWYTIERQGCGFLRLMNACLEKEKRQNTSRGDNIGTWDAGIASAMYYRSRPRRREEET